MRTSKETWILILCLAVGLLVAGCGGSEDSESTSVADAESASAERTPAETPTQPEPDPEMVEVVLPPADEPTETPSAELEVEVELFTPREGLFAEAADALDALSSYRYTSAFLFVDEEDGEAESGSIDISGAIGGPDRQHLIWTNVEDGSRFELIRIADQAWIQDEGEWTAVPTLVADAMTQAVLIYAPAASWSGLYGALESTSTYVGREEVNGIPATHYTSTYEEWANAWSGEVLNASADVWIADAGYPVKYRFQATGVDEDGDRGSVSWIMELYDVGEAIDITAPQTP